MAPPHLVILDADSGERIAWVAASPYLTVFDNLERAGVRLPNRCGGHAICGLCHVEVAEGAEALAPMVTDERELLEQVGALGPRVRLACRIRLPPSREHLVLKVRLSSSE